ncbi:putative uroporphyrin-III C-methyltransferase [Candidatus Zinderia insecticola CARI]|uniref:Putative uroporphyrin-III C-methyltransferase n=1 Tax=Zinderia insecticola (strain CARI) TaxID=871271 RepID=E0TIX3_ZINIC|nr:putative uroporphyrin-III C-methyltransferase [Candidatus Zinderia insecticola CARI]
MINNFFYKKIYFIGAGPGISNFINLKALKYLIFSNIILFDFLITKKNIYSSIYSIKISIGKRIGKKNIFQNNINNLIKFYYFKYNKISRFKGGNPIIFSNIKSEVNILKILNINYLIIPGLNSGLSSLSLFFNIFNNIFFRFIILFTFKKKNIKNIFNFINNFILVKYMFRNKIKILLKNLILNGYNLNNFLFLIENISLKKERIFYIKIINIINYLNFFFSPLILFIKIN